MTEPTDKPRDPELADEQQLDEYLKGDSSVSRQYRQLHSGQVPAELDRLVLRRAGEAVKSEPARSRPAWVRWTAPLAVAASAVLVLSIVIESGVRDDTVTLQAPRAVMQAKERQPEESKAEEIVVDEYTEPASGYVPPAVAPSPDAAPSPADAPSLDVAPTPAAPPAPADTPTRTAAPPPAAEPSRAAAPPAEPSVAAPQSLRAAEPANEASKTVASKRPPPPPVAAPAPARPAPVRTEAALSASSISRAADDAERLLRDSSSEDLARKQSNAIADQARQEEKRSAAAQAYSRQISAEVQPPRTYTDPEEWLKDIRQLRQENKQDQADQEWRRFRAAFPNYQVAETDAAREVKK